MFEKKFSSVEQYTTRKDFSITETDLRLLHVRLEI